MYDMKTRKLKISALENQNCVHVMNRRREENKKSHE